MRRIREVVVFMNSNPKSGMSIIEGMAAALIIAVIAAVGANQFVRITETQSYEGARRSQLSLLEQLKGRILNPDVIHRSLQMSRPPGVGTSPQKNLLLANCYFGGDCDERITDITDPLDVNLYDPNLPEGRLAGTENNPANYDIEGGASENCDRPIDCFFAVTAYVSATCPGYSADNYAPPPTCDAPTAINFRVQISAINPDLLAKASAKGRPFPTIPDPQGAAAGDHTVVVKTSDIKARFDRGCQELTQVLTGFYEDGRPKCRCFSPKFENGQEVFSGIVPVCQEQKCATDEIVAGFEDSGAIKCLKKTDNALCREVSLQTESDCGPGGYISSVNYGKCQSVPQGKSTTNEVECDQDKGRCCRNLL